MKNSHRNYKIVNQNVKVITIAILVGTKFLMATKHLNLIKAGARRMVSKKVTKSNVDRY